MLVFLYRPSPQVSQPSTHSAIICYESAASNVKLQRKQMETAAVDITWPFLLALFMAVNTVLWAISYPEVRSLHLREETEECINVALEIISKCRERWPGTGAASHLYTKLAKACLRSYDSRDSSHPPSSRSATSPPSSLTDANSPSASDSSATTGSMPPSQKVFNSPPPQFGYVFNQMPEQIPPFDYHSLGPAQPSFRSNSIFMNPSNGQSDRRFSYFPPDFTQPQTLPNAWNPMAAPPPPNFPPAEAISLGSSPLSIDSSFFAEGEHYSFPPHLYSAQSHDIGVRQGSLSQEQQLELMQALETDGLTDIDNFMNHSAPIYHTPMKFES